MGKNSRSTRQSPYADKFESVAKQAKRISGSIRIDVPDGYVKLEIITHGPAEVVSMLPRNFYATCEEVFVQPAASSGQV